MRTLVVVGIALLAAACNGCADVASKEVGVCYVDGYAEPGEDARLIVHTRGSLAGQIHRVTVERSELLPVDTVLFEQDVGYGEYLVVNSKPGWRDFLERWFVGDPQHPQVQIKVPIAKDVKARGSTPLELKIACLRAVSSGAGGSFETESADSVLKVPITIVTSRTGVPTRLRDFAARFFVGLALCGAVLGYFHLKDRYLKRTPDWLALVFSCVLFYGVLVLSSDPISANLGIVQSAYRGLVFVLTVVASMFLLVRAGLWFAARRKVAAPPTPLKSAEPTT